MTEMPDCCFYESGYVFGRSGLFRCETCLTWWKRIDGAWIEDCEVYEPNPNTSEERLALHRIVGEIALAAHRAIDDSKNVEKGDGWCDLGLGLLRRLEAREDAEVRHEEEWNDPEAVIRENGDKLAFMAMRADLVEERIRKAAMHAVRREED